MRSVADTSRRSILAALAANNAVAVIKLVAYFLSGSASILVEAFHSIIDTRKSGLLLLGMRQSKRPPDTAAGGAVRVENPWDP